MLSTKQAWWLPPTPHSLVSNAKVLRHISRTHIGALDWSHIHVPPPVKDWLLPKWQPARPPPAPSPLSIPQNGVLVGCVHLIPLLNHPPPVPCLALQLFNYPKTSLCWVEILVRTILVLFYYVLRQFGERSSTAATQIPGSAERRLLGLSVPPFLKPRTDPTLATTHETLRAD